MSLMSLRASGGFESLELVKEDRPEPWLGEVPVRISTCSLNFHDAIVILGTMPYSDGRNTISDGAEEVVASEGEFANTRCTLRELNDSFGGGGRFSRSHVRAHSRVPARRLPVL